MADFISIDDIAAKHIAFALTLTPVKAVEYLKSLGVVFSSNWLETLDAIQARSFAIAGVMDERVLLMVQAELADAVAVGRVWSKTQENILDRLAEMGLPALSEQRVRIVVETVIRQSRNAGRWTTFEANKDEQPFLRYRTVGDENVRPSHADLNGVVFPVNDPFWESHYPQIEGG